MSKQSRIPGSVSPLLWLAPLPFALAMCLPLDLSRSTPAPAGYDRVATAPQKAQPQDGAASAATPAPH
jgi:hypothetical protein